MARMFPSVSLNHAVLAPPPIAMLFFIERLACVLLEHDAPCLEFGHLRFDVVDLPIRLAGLGCPSVACRVHEDFGTSAFVNHAARIFLLERESNTLFIEFPRPRDVGRWNVRANRCLAQHESLLWQLAIDERGCALLVRVPHRHVVVNHALKDVSHHFW